MDFSLFYFDGNAERSDGNLYRLFLESAKFADRHEFAAIWTPERHFHPFGGLYPNPSVLGTAIATVTEQIQIRAGSVVLPLQDPVRVAEEWSVVDNLSGGRVGLSVASGWTLDDFVLSRDSFDNRKSLMWQNLDILHALWQGDSVERQDATGKSVRVETFPKPIQSRLPIWITCQSPGTFMKAGEMGANVLTALLYETIDDVAEKIALYRDARERHGFDPDAGQVTLMVHTFVGDDFDGVKQQVQGPFCNYLKTHLNLLEHLAKGMGLDVSLDTFSERDIDDLLVFGVENFLNGRALVGTPQTCQPMVEQMWRAGINEVACLIDFNPDFEAVMASLPHLAKLKEQCAFETQPLSSVS
jgi:natural product biosynthesis luciferase-like monooxygenase protein